MKLHRTTRSERLALALVLTLLGVAAGLLFAWRSLY
jgi:hypothetical protein